MHASGLAHRIASGTLWVSVETWGGQLLQFGIFVVLSRLLGPETYGVMGLALLVNMCAEVVIVSGGWGDAIVQRRDLTREHEASIFYLLLALGIVLALIVIALARPAARLFDTGDLSAIMPWLALSLPISALGVVPRALLRRQMQFAPFAIRSLLSMLAAGAVAVGLAVADAGVWSLVAFQLVRPAASAAVIWAITGWRPPATFSARAIREVLPFVTGALGDRAVVVGDAILQRTMIGLALGPVALGLFTFACKISELLLQSVNRPLARILLPTASRMRPGDAKMEQLVGGAAALAGLLILPTVAGLAIVAPEFVALVFGPAWTPAVPVLQGLMFVAAASPFTQITTSVIYSSGASRWQLALSTLAIALLGLFLLVYGTREMASIIAALITRTSIMIPVRLFVAQYATGSAIPRFCARALRPLVATLLMVGVLLTVREHLLDGLPAAARLALSIAIGAAVYVTAAFLFARQALGHAVKLASALRG